MPRFRYKKVSESYARRKFKGRLTYRERQELQNKEFVFPKTRRYPIYNASHARNALSRVSRYGTPSEKKAVCQAVADKYPEIHEQHCTLHHVTTHRYVG